MWPRMSRLRSVEMRGVRREPGGGVQLQRQGILPVVHGTTDERDRREPDGAGAAADRPAPVGADVPVPVATATRPGRRAVWQAHAHLRGDGADVLRRARGSGGRLWREDGRGHGCAADVVRSAAESSPAPGRSRRCLARAGRGAMLARTRAPEDERGRRRSREHGQADRAAPSSSGPARDRPGRCRSRRRFRS